MRGENTNLCKWRMTIQRTGKAMGKGTDQSYTQHWDRKTAKGRLGLLLSG